MQPGPTFTIIIPTRNRPALFLAALDSVLAQTDAAFEIIVVNDGSEDAQREAYRALPRTDDPRIRLFDLPQTVRGHGQSYALNFGAAHANGTWLGFLDDDDEWTDPGYLARVARVLAADPAADLHLADQAAFAAGRKLTQTVWIEDLPAKIAGRIAPDETGAFLVTPEDLLQAHGFCHLNTTIIRADLFAKMRGFDDGIRYECDRDFYLRAIDAAARIKYSPGAVSRHNVPDPTQKSNMSTLVTNLERHVFQIRVLDKAAIFAQSPAVKRHGLRHKAIAVKKIAEELEKTGAHDRAAYYAREALLIGPSLGWLAYCLKLHLKAGQSALFR